MASDEIDVIDVVAIVLTPIAGFLAFGAISLELHLWETISAAHLLYDSHGTEITVAGLVALGGTAWVVMTNEIDGSDYETWEYWLILAAFALVPGYMLIELINGYVSAHYQLAWIISIVQAIVVGYVSYTE